VCVFFLPMSKTVIKKNDYPLIIRARVVKLFTTQSELQKDWENVCVFQCMIKNTQFWK
jgi:hypothetical protein